MRQAGRVGICGAALLTLLFGAQVRAMDAEREVEKLMRSQYNVKSRDDKGWHIQIWGADPVDNSYTIYSITHKKISTLRGERLYVFISGSRDYLTSPAAPGIGGAFILEEHDGQVSLVAGANKMPFGGNETGPHKATLMLFGPNQFYGWVVEDGAASQGFIDSWKTIILPRGRIIVNAGRVNSHSSNSGFCDDEEASKGDYWTKRLKTCRSLDMRMKIEDSDKSVKIFPLSVRTTGTRGGQPIRPTSVLITFDEKSARYKIPKTLREPTY